MARLLLHSGLSCFCILCCYRTAYAYNNTTNSSSVAFCFYVPTSDKIQVLMQLDAVVCNPNNSHSILPFARSTGSAGGCTAYSSCSKTGIEDGSCSGFWVYSPITMAPQHVGMEYRVNLSLHPQHESMAMLMSFILTYMPESFGLNPNITRNFNYSTVSCVSPWERAHRCYRFCVNQNASFQDYSGPFSLYFDKPQGWDIYFSELLRPFLLSLLVLGVSQI
uniref:Minor glycoprotein n=1 Tax=Kibale red colobus virus 1 TaxID=1885929 RepID=F5BD15_9NIDO|nr:minor glycoprotein [Kibale red colobus virus 1]AHH53533.1 minor glycoprotein [Kibale red colobus virus 1]APP93298.1 ORF 3' protein [Kibale red colobus virus 1]APP93337.1 ORF 3' protein [Kibale red colobus virus 1]APP93350.1 ORF 3' protein [Kibale red colobus virus 1]